MLSVAEKLCYQTEPVSEHAPPLAGNTPLGKYSRPHLTHL